MRATLKTVGLILGIAACGSPEAPKPAAPLLSAAPVVYNDNEDGFLLVAELESASMDAVSRLMGARSEMLRVHVGLSSQGVLFVLGADDQGTDASPTTLTLDSLMAFCRGKIALNIEMDEYALAGSALESLHERIRAYGMERHVLLSVRNPKLISSEDTIPTSWIITEQTSDFASEGPVIAAAEGFYAVELPLSLLQNGSVDSFRTAGLRTIVSGADDEVSMRRAIEAGVDGISTRRPDLLLQVLRNLDAVE